MRSVPDETLRGKILAGANPLDVIKEALLSMLDERQPKKEWGWFNGLTLGLKIGLELVQIAKSVEIATPPKPKKKRKVGAK